MTAGNGGGARGGLPGPACACGCERDRARRLARARQQLAERGCLLPGWDALSGYEQDMAILEARNWLRAAITAGLAAPCPVHGDAGPGGGLVPGGTR